jgi:site-specific DNA recombinase
VSTQRQGQHGTSLTEQQAAIERFARNWDFRIIKRFEERETAAKQGRPVFLEMLKELKAGRADGVIIHKIDRSARNLKDWADLGALIDAGKEVHFASESLDLNSRGGRLSADIQAVVASDYIRNLREETKKGIYGRLRQGLYPFRAPIGYLDSGKGEVKAVDPAAAPFIRRAFEMYATGDWGLIALMDKLNDLGLRNRIGRKLTLNGLATALHNPFYMGVIKIRKTGEMFAGAHDPIISKELYDRVQDVFAGKNIKKETHHFFVYRRMVHCQNCRHFLTAEVQKGNHYYRCRTRHCMRRCLKEEEIAENLENVLKQIEFTDLEYELLGEIIKTETVDLEKVLQAAREHIKLQQNQIKDRYSRLANAVLKGVFDNETYIQKKSELVLEEHALKERFANLMADQGQVLTELEEICELANSAYLSFESAKPEDKRDLVKTLTANLVFDGKSVSIKMEKPFQIIAERQSLPIGSPYREARRTLKTLFNSLLKYFQTLSAINKNDDEFQNSFTPKKGDIPGNSIPMNY